LEEYKTVEGLILPKHPITSANQVQWRRQSKAMTQWPTSGNSIMSKKAGAPRRPFSNSITEQDHPSS
jgi:hypothetical protein